MLDPHTEAALDALRKRLEATQGTEVDQESDVLFQGVYATGYGVLEAVGEVAKAMVDGANRVSHETRLRVTVEMLPDA